MPEKVATLKKQNKQLKSQIAELSSELKNLKEMLEKRRTSDLNSWIYNWNFRPWDGEESTVL